MIDEEPGLRRAQFLDGYHRHLYILRDSRLLGLLTAASILQFANATLLAFLKSNPARYSIVGSMLSVAAALIFLVIHVLNPVKPSALHPRMISITDLPELIRKGDASTVEELTEEILLETKYVAQVISLRDKYTRISTWCLIIGIVFQAAGVFIAAWFP